MNPTYRTCQETKAKKRNALAESLRDKTLKLTLIFKKKKTNEMLSKNLVPAC